MQNRVSPKHADCESPKVAAFSGVVLLLACFQAGFAADLSDSETLQRQIDTTAAAGGGRVVVPAGRHLVGQLDMRSNVELHLEKGAVLEGKVGLEHYRVTELPYSEGTWSAVVSAIGVTNVAITGEGEIFGNGTAWPQPEDYGGNQEGCRPRGIFFADCKGVRLADFKLRDAACWGVVFKCCEDVDVRRLMIDTHANANNDGIDLEAKNVVIADCDIDAGDDAVCLKSNTPDFVVENVLVSNVTARSHCNALKLGTASHGTIRNVRFVDCRTEAPRRDFIDRRFGRNRRWYEEDPGRAKRYPGAAVGEASGSSSIVVENVDGGTVENVVYRNITVGGSRTPIFIRAGTRSGRSCGTPPSNKYVFRDITLENVTGEAMSGVASSVTGVPGCRIQGVTLRNVHVVTRGCGETAAERTRPVPEVAGKYPDAHMFGCMLPAYGLYVRHVDGLTLENVMFTLRDGDTDRREMIVREDVTATGIELIEPRDRAVVSLLLPGHKEWLAMPRKERVAKFADMEGYRKRMKETGTRPAHVRLAWQEVENETEALGAVSPDVKTDRRFVVEGSDWVPLKYVKTPARGSALDFSTQPYFHRPAGKFGRVVVRNGHFEFEHLPGVPQRFYGVNLCNDANFPDHATAEEMAERLARLGYNCVRLHHHDKILAGGKGPEINPEAAERMDFLVAELIKRGIYIESDLFVSRGTLGPADLGVADSGVPWRRGYEIKTLFTLHPPAFSNWCAFARSWLTHRNPYTGRTYAEEPCWTGMSLINEGRYVFPYEQTRHLKPFKRVWKSWITARRVADPACYPGVKVSGSYPDIKYADMDNGTMPQVCCDFAADMQRDFLSRVRAFLVGELGFRAPLTNENNAPNNVPISKARSDAYDYVEVHAYGAGQGKGSPCFVPNRNVFAPVHDRVTATAWQRLVDKPFSITETSYGQPNPHRAGGCVKLGALAAIQDWDSIFHFAYAHGLNRFPEGAFGGGTRFDIQQDPVKALADRVPFLLFLRRDLDPAEEGVALEIDDAALHPANGLAATSFPPWGTNLMWRCRVGTAVAGRRTAGFRTLPLLAGMSRRDIPVRVAGTTAVRLDESADVFSVETPKTIVGVLSSGALETDRLAFDLGAHPATVVAAALDNRVLTSSGRILMMVLGDVQRFGEVYSDATRTVMLHRGDNGKTVVRRMSVPVRLRHEESSACRVYALDTSGCRMGEVKATAESGWISFVASTAFKPDAGVVAWEIVAQSRMDRR